VVNNSINKIFEVPGGSQAQYDEVMKHLDLANHKQKGLVSHCAGPIPGGWRVCDVWESWEDADAFATNRLMAILQKAGVPHPIISVYPIAHYMKPAELHGAKDHKQAGALNAVFEIAGGDKAAYEKTISMLGLPGNPPAGQVAHAAGPIPGGWRVVDTWESKEAMDAFFRDRLMAVLQQMGWMPIPHIYPLHNYLTSKEV
jgi:hypothetical protein